MALDAGIYGAVGRGVKSLAEYDAEADARKLNRLQLLVAQQGLDQKTQEISDANALRAVVSQFGADETANYNALLRTGNVKAAQDYQKGRADLAKLKAETGEKTLGNQDKAFKYYKDVLETVQTPEEARNFLTHSFTDPNIGSMLRSRGTLEEGLARIPTDPQAFQQWKAQAALGIGKLAEMAKVNNVNQGDKVTTQLVNPVTGQVQTLSTSQINQSPDNIANNARAAAEGAANRAVTMRGQDITKQAALQGGSVQIDGAGNMVVVPNKVVPGQAVSVSPVVGTDGKPVQGKDSGANKPLNDTQAKALLFGKRMEAADSIITQLDGKYSPGALDAKASAERTPLVGGLVGAGANTMLSEADQKAEQAQRDFINAVLRRESGAAISPGEFDSARKQYFPQVGDSAAVKAQKKANRKLATDGLLAEVPSSQRNSIGGSSGAAAPANDDPLGLRGR